MQDNYNHELNKARHFQIVQIHPDGREEIEDEDRDVTDGLAAAAIEGLNAVNEGTGIRAIAREIDPATLQPLPADVAKLPLGPLSEDSPKRREGLAVEKIVHDHGFMVGFCDEYYIDGRPCETWACDVNAFGNEFIGVDTTRSMAAQIADHFDAQAKRLREAFRAAGLLDGGPNVAEILEPSQAVA